MNPIAPEPQDCAYPDERTDFCPWIPRTPERWVEDIKRALSDDLLTPERRRDIRHERLSLQARKVRGHCYVATEAAYYLFGKELGYVPERVRCADGDTHWWLRNKETGHVIDPTVEQTDGMFDYRRGKAGGFLTKEPSRRCQILMKRVLDAANKSETNTAIDPVPGEPAPEICVLVS
jgi:hypothetical protein